MRAFIITVLVLLVASGASAWTLRGHVDPPGGSPLVLCSVSVSCAHHGSPARSCTQQNYAHRSLCQGDSQWEGVARYFASITEYRCSTDSSGPTTITNTPTARGAETDVEWCVTGNWVGGTCRSQVEPSNPARTAMYCDRTRPHTYSFETSEFWYRDDFTREASFQDTQHAWRIEAQQRDRGPPLQSYSSYTVVGTSSAGTTSFPRNVPISVGIGSCATTGSDRCEVRVRFSDYWLNDRILSNTYNIDRIAPESDAVVLRSVGGSADPHHTDSRGGWYRGGVALRVYSHDTVDTADQSGLKSIFVQWDQLASGCSSHGSGSYTGYPVSGPDATIHHSVTSDGVVHARFCYYAEDNARTGTSTVGNREAVKATSNDLFIDGQPPTTAISPSTTGAPGALSDGWTQNGDFDVTVTCDDGVGSGCDVIHYHSNRNTDAMTCPSAASYEGSWAVSGPIGSVSRQYTDTLCEDGNDCDFTFCAYSVDNVGNVGPVATMNYRIDRAPPQITGFEPTLENTRHADWYNRNLQMRATIRDDHGGGGSGFGGDASTCHVRRQGTTTPTVSMPCSGQGGDYTTTVTVGSGGVCPNQGACVLELVARDRVGNEATATYTVYIDTVIPSEADLTTVDTGHACTYRDPSTGIMYYGLGYNNLATCADTVFDVQAQVSDPAPSAGIWEIRWHSLNPHVMVQPSSPLITRSTSNDRNWERTVTYRAMQTGHADTRDIFIDVEDRSYPGPRGLGNVRDNAGSFAVNFDSQPPQSTLNPGFTEWRRDDISFAVTATDDKVPVRTIWYDITTSVGEQTQPTDPPCDSDPRTYSAQPSTGVSSAVTCPDREICWARLCFAAEDEVSNLEDVHTEFFGIDKSPPVVVIDSVTIGGTGPVPAHEIGTGDLYYINDDFQITFTATDRGSGVDRCEYRVRTGSGSLGAWRAVTPACPRGDAAYGEDDDLVITHTIDVTAGWEEECRHEGPDACTIEIRAIDVVGNVGSTALGDTDSIDLNFDFTPPVSTVTWREDDRDYQDGDNWWYQDTALYDLSCFDPDMPDRAGCLVTYVNHNTPSCTAANAMTNTGAFWGEGTTTFEITNCDAQRCEREVCHRAQDDSVDFPGNVEAVRRTSTYLTPGTILIDAVPPDTTLTDIPYEWSNGSYLLEFSCSDRDASGEGSGCALFELDTTTYTDFTGDITWPPACGEPDVDYEIGANPQNHLFLVADGVERLYRICARSHDNVGHIGEWSSQLLGIDTSPPTVDPFIYFPGPRSPDAPSSTLEAATDTWFNETFTVQATFRDSASGVGYCAYRITDGTSTRDWIDLECEARLELDHTADRVQTKEFTIYVNETGRPADSSCDTQGRDRCVIEVMAIDAVGEVMPIHSEAVSIDYTPPTCELYWVHEGVGAINQYYNDSNKTFFYNNDDPYTDYGVGNFTVEVHFTDEHGSLADQDVSGIIRTVFPTLTGPRIADSESETHGMERRVTRFPSYERTLEYTYDDGSVYSTLIDGPAVVEVYDEAGNRGTCEFGFVRDTAPPVPQTNIVTFNHVNLELPTFAGDYDPNLEIRLGALDPARHGESLTAGSGLRNTQIRLIRGGEGITAGSTQYYPECPAFDMYDSLYPFDHPLIAVSEEGFSGLLETYDRDALMANLSAHPGSCFQFFGVFYDNVNNFHVVRPHLNEPAHQDKVVAIDANPGNTPALACGFFDRYDNCNDRSAYLNGLPVDQFLTTSCPGSCRYGNVHRLDDEGTASDSTGSTVRIQGIDKPGYSFTITSGARYRLFNITDPYPASEQGRYYNIEATPRPADFDFYESRVRDVFIQQEPATPGLPAVYPPVGQTDFLIGFRSTLCTPSCTLSTDPAPGTCRIDCAGYGGCPDEGEDGYDALVACQGLSSGFITYTSDGVSTKIYQCCTSEIDPSEIQPLSAAFEVDAENVARSERLVMLGNKLVKLVVITFD